MPPVSATAHSRTGSASRSGMTTSAITTTGQTRRPHRFDGMRRRRRMSDAPARRRPQHEDRRERDRYQRAHRLAHESVARGSTTGSARRSPSAVPAFVKASSRCCPAPFSTVVAVALPTRIATTHDQDLRDDDAVDELRTDPRANQRIGQQEQRRGRAAPR